MRTGTEIVTDNYFVSVTKIRQNITNMLNCYFSKNIYPLAHQTKYQQVEN